MALPGSVLRERREKNRSDSTRGLAFWRKMGRAFRILRKFAAGMKTYGVLHFRAFGLGNADLLRIRNANPMRVTGLSLGNRDQDLVEFPETIGHDLLVIRVGFILNIEFTILSPFVARC
jgi:hypothetical protein